MRRIGIASIGCHGTSFNGLNNLLPVFYDITRMPLATIDWE